MTDGVGPAARAAAVAVVAFDCADPSALAGFWASLLGGTVEVDPSGDATVSVAGSLPIDFFRVPEPKTVKNRLHLDLRAPSHDEAVATALRLGATRADDVYAGDRWQVLRDPEGNEFCILRSPIEP